MAGRDFPDATVGKGIPLSEFSPGAYLNPIWLSEELICTELTRPCGVFSCRNFLCVPNVSHGWGLDYEADLIAVTPSGYAYEIEIKTNFRDLLADRRKNKWKQGLDKRIKCFYYAVPLELLNDTKDHVDPSFGIVVVGKHRSQEGYYSRIERKPKILPHIRLTDADILKLHRLGTLRYWDMRHYGKATCIRDIQTSISGEALTPSTETTSLSPTSSSSLESQGPAISTSEPITPL